jgi:hypothetical protein
MGYLYTHYTYPASVLLVYTIVATAGFLCNLAVIISILLKPMRTPNIRYVLILTVALFLEQIFAVPQIYVRYGDVCSASGALETYFEMLMLCSSVFLAVAGYYQLRLVTFVLHSCAAHLIHTSIYVGANTLSG